MFRGRLSQLSFAIYHVVTAGTAAICLRVVCFELGQSVKRLDTNPRQSLTGKNQPEAVPLEQPLTYRQLSKDQALL